MEQPNSSISNFRKFLISLLIPWLAIALVTGFVSTWLFERYVVLGSEISGAYKVNRILKAEDGEEIPILGSSRAEGGYIPAILGDHFFNYGISGTQDNVSLFFLEQLCAKKSKQPILLNIDLDGLNEGTGDLKNFIVNANEPEIQKLLGKNFQFRYRLPIVKYYGAFEVYFKYFLNSSINLTKFTNKGASIEKNALPKVQFDQIVAERKKLTNTFKNDPVLEDKLFKIIRKNRHRTIIVLSAPYHVSVIHAFTNFPAVQSFFKRLSKEVNVKVIDCSRMNYPDSYFFDTVHLNFQGAKAFSGAVRDSLQKTLK